MESIKWTDELSVGVVEMDEQHQKLISMINRLISEQKILSTPETIAQLITDMTDYAEVHFRAEEFLLSEYGYEEIDMQVAQHEAFIANTQKFIEASDVGPNILSKELLDYLKQWLVQHILEQDMKYKDFFIKKGVS
jgi:hemerythrin